MSAIKVHVSKDFVEMSVADKIVLGDKVIAALILAVLMFPNITVPATGVNSLTSANVDLKAKHDAFKVNPLLHPALELSETAWITAFQKDADFVDSLAHGNAAMITSSGYNSTKDIRVPAAIPATPVIKTSGSTKTGGLDIDLVPQKDADAFGGLVYTGNLTPVFNDNQVTFSFMVGEVPSQISFVISKNRKFSFKNLMSMIKMKLVAFATNSAGMSTPTKSVDEGIL